MCLKTTSASTSTFIHKQKDHSLLSCTGALTEMKTYIRREKCQLINSSVPFFRVFSSLRPCDVGFLDAVVGREKHGKKSVMMRSRGLNWLFGGPSRLSVPTRGGAPSLPGSCSPQPSSRRSWEIRQKVFSGRKASDTVEDDVMEAHICFPL